MSGDADVGIRRTPAAAALAFCDRHRVLAFALLLCLYAAAFNGQWRPTPDSCAYVSLGRNLAAGAGYTTNGWGWSRVHVGMPLALAATFRLFGPATMWPALALVAMAGLGALALTYRLIEDADGRAVAVVVSLLVGTCFTFAQHLYETLTDMPAFFGVMLSLAACDAVRRAPDRRRRLGWAAALALGASLAIVMRPANWGLLTLILVALAAPHLRTPRRRLTVAIGGGALALLVLGWLWHAAATEPDGYAASLVRWGHNATVKGSVGPGQDRSWTRAIDALFGTLTVKAALSIGLGPLASNVAAVALWSSAAWACRRRPLWVAWVSVTMAMLLVYPQPQARYDLPVLPFLALGFWRMAAWVGRRRHRPFAGIGLAVCLALWIAPNVARLARLAIAQHAHDVLSHVDNGRYVPLREMAEIVRRTLPSDATVVSQEGVALEGFAPERRFRMTIDGDLPPTFAPEAEALLRSRRLFAVDDGTPDLSDALARDGLSQGPAIATVARPAWERPPAPARWFTDRPARALPPLTLREIGRVGIVRPTTSAAE